MTAILRSICDKNFFLPIDKNTRRKFSGMLDLKLTLYSKCVLGSSLDPTTTSKKTSLLTRLGLCDQATRVISLDDSGSLLALFRVVHFTSADLLVCRDFSKQEILKYDNPCNLKNAIKSAIDACTGAGVFEPVLELESLLSSSFHGGLHCPSGNVRKADESIFSSAKPILQNLEIIEGNHGYSLVSKSGFNRGDYVMTLTDDIPISLFSALRDSTFPGRHLAEQGLHPDTIFLLYLIYLRDIRGSLTNMIHRDFFLHQPSNYGTLFELPHSVVEALDEPDLCEAVLSQNKNLNEICKSLQPSPSFEDLLWAKSLCTSRGFSLKIIPSSELEEKLICQYYPTRHITTILPLVHFINHDFSAQLETPIVCPGGCIALRALVDIEAGSEVFLNYGGFTNKEFMLNYGFYIKNNPYDSLEVGDKVFRRGAIHSSQTVFKSPESLPNVPAEYQDLVSGYLADRACFRSACT